MNRRSKKMLMFALPSAAALVVVFQNFTFFDYTRFDRPDCDVMIGSAQEFAKIQSGIARPEGVRRYCLTRDIKFTAATQPKFGTIQHIRLDGQGFSLIDLRVGKSGLFPRINESMIVNLTLKDAVYDAPGAKAEGVSALLAGTASGLALKRFHVRNPRFTSPMTGVACGLLVGNVPYGRFSVEMEDVFVQSQEKLRFNCPRVGGVVGAGELVVNIKDLYLGVYLERAWSACEGSFGALGGSIKAKVTGVHIKANLLSTGPKTCADNAGATVGGFIGGGVLHAENSSYIGDIVTQQARTVGGLIGNTPHTAVNKVSLLANITANDAFSVGGAVGQITDRATIENSFIHVNASRTTIRKRGLMGGIVGLQKSIIVRTSEIKVKAVDEQAAAVAGQGTFEYAGLGNKPLSESTQNALVFDSTLDVQLTAKNTRGRMTGFTSYDNLNGANCDANPEDRRCVPARHKGSDVRVAMRWGRSDMEVVGYAFIKFWYIGVPDSNYRAYKTLRGTPIAGGLQQALWRGGAPQLKSPAAKLAGQIVAPLVRQAERSVVISGSACEIGLESPLGLVIYAGTDSQMGIPIGYTTPTQKGTGGPCGTQNAAFSYQLPEPLVRKYAGRRIWIKAVGRNTGLTLSNSGRYEIPSLK